MCCSLRLRVSVVCAAGFACSATCLFRYVGYLVLCVVCCLWWFVVTFVLFVLFGRLLIWVWFTPQVLMIILVYLVVVGLLCLVCCWVGFWVLGLRVLLDFGGYVDLILAFIALFCYLYLFDCLLFVGCSFGCVCLQFCLWCICFIVYFTLWFVFVC